MSAKDAKEALEDLVVHVAGAVVQKTSAKAVVRIAKTPKSKKEKK